MIWLGSPSRVLLIARGVPRSSYLVREVICSITSRPSSALMTGPVGHSHTMVQLTERAVPYALFLPGCYVRWLAPLSMRATCSLL